MTDQGHVTCEEFEKAGLRVEEDEGRPDLRIVTAETLAGLVRGQHGPHHFLIVDARFPYEFAGGHIQGSINASTSADLHPFLITLARDSLVIFHCEFSEYRAPSLCRWLRNEDRKANIENFPHLSYPNLYVLKGGYAEFFSKFSELCEPLGYVRMKEEGRKRERKEGMEKVKRDRGRTGRLL